MPPAQSLTIPNLPTPTSVTPLNRKQDLALHDESPSALKQDRWGLIRLRDQYAGENAATAIEDGIDDGSVFKLSRGAYAITSAFAELVPWAQHVAATAAHAGDSLRTVIVGHSACLWHGLWIHDYMAATVEVHRINSLRNSADLVRFYDAPLSHADVVTRHGLRVTSVARTIVDVYILHGPGAAFVALASALSQGLCTRDDVRTVVDRLGWGEQVPRLEEILDGVADHYSHVVDAVFHAQLVLSVVPLLPARSVLQVEEFGATRDCSSWSFGWSRLRVHFVVDAVFCPLQLQVFDKGCGCAREALVERGCCGENTVVLSSADVLNGAALAEVVSRLPSTVTVPESLVKDTVALFF